MNQNQSNEITFPEIEIPRLIDELQNLNDQKYSQMHDMLFEVYNTLYEFQITQSRVIKSISKTPNLNEEDLIGLCQGVGAIFSYFPRPVQLMSVYLLFNHEQNKGRLAQIYTGEGKTLIVAMLAVLVAIKKQSFVDILTSSPVLAKRDVEELQKFYEYFKLKVSHNIGDLKQQDGNMLNCYKANIVYGDAHSFEGDILRHEYSEYGTLGNRKQEYAIVDEVDSMLVDGSGHQTFLSSSIPGMLDIIKILRLIWAEICKVKIRKGGKMFIINDNELYEVQLAEYVSKALDFQIQEAVGHLMLPYRLNYIYFMKDTWIKKAIFAKFHLKEKTDYVIDNNQIRIVDYSNTGVVSDHKVQWSGGLHQFVQLKHNLNVSPLSVCTNFMSNICFFKRYKNKILGLTGTLGSKYTKQLLANQYNVDFILIPPNKPRLLKELPGKATANEVEWIEEIWKDTQAQVDQNRAVLIINESIKDVQNIAQQFKSRNQEPFLYTNDSQVINKYITEKNVIIATNLAGRGTDLITNQGIEKNGGLHVIVTFLPKNIRIQEQAFGRTGRSGRKGTARLIVQTDNSEQSILYYEKLEKFNLEYNLLNLLRQDRDRFEETLMKQNDEYMNKLMYEDECFQEFCQIAKSMVKMKEEPALFKSMEEKWALYLEMNRERGLRKEDIKGVIAQDMNPKYLVQHGLNNNDEKSIKKASSISQNDPAAVYYEGCFELKKLKQENIKSGIQILTKAKSLFQQKIDNEKGFHLAQKVNQQLMNEFQEIDEQDNLKMKNEQNNAINPLAFEPLFEEFPKFNPQFPQFEKQTKLEKRQNFNPMPQVVQQQQQNVQSIFNFQNNPQIQPQAINIRNLNSNQNIFQNQQNNLQKLNKIVQQNIQQQEVVQVSQISKIQQKQMQKLSFSVDSKVENQVQVYQNFINNIDELISSVKGFDPNKEEISFKWIPTIQYNQKNQENQDVKDKQEVIQDGPFPKMGKLLKKKKETSFWSRVAMFFIGVLEFTAGCFICACTAGAAVGIGKYLILEGIQDMANAITSAFKGTDIDWGQWGQQKVISFCTTLALAGPIAIKEAFTVVGKSFKTIKKISMVGFLQTSLQKVGFEGLRKAGEWLSNTEKQDLQSQYDTVRLIANQAEGLKNKQQIWAITQDILREQIAYKVISESTAKEIENFAKVALDESQGNANIFKNILCRLCGNFLNVQMAKSKSNQNEQGQKKNIKEVYNRNQCNVLEQFQTQIESFKQNEQQIKNKLSVFQDLFLISFQRDSEIQMLVLTLDLSCEFLSDQQEVQGQITSIKFQQKYQEYITQSLSQIQDSEFENLDMSQFEAVNKFYHNQVRQIIYQLLSKIKDNMSKIEPFNILLINELKQQFFEVNNNFTQMQQNLKERQDLVNCQVNLVNEGQQQNESDRQTALQMIEDYKQEEKSFINKQQSFQSIQSHLEACITFLQNIHTQGTLQQDGIVYSPQEVNELYQQVQMVEFPDMLIQILYSTISNAIAAAKTIRSKTKKLFSNPFTEALEETLIKEMENKIYEKKISALDKQIQNNMNFQENDL